MRNQIRSTAVLIGIAVFAFAVGCLATTGRGRAHLPMDERVADLEEKIQRLEERLTSAEASLANTVRPGYQNATQPN